MDRRTAYTLRLERISLHEKRMGMLTMFGVAAGVTVLLAQALDRSPIDTGAGKTFAAVAAAVAPKAGAAAPAQAGAARRVYPYSIIPGGVADVAELKSIIRSDSVVAMHYATFNVDKAHAVTVTKPRSVYVSYRKGDQVYWTAKKLTLVPGETLLSDGEHEMRARCANRISDTPQFPVEPHGPSERELDTVEPVAPADGGSFVNVSAPPGLDIGGGLPGQRFYPVSFPNDAGLRVPPVEPLPRERGGRPWAPGPDRSNFYPPAGFGARWPDTDPVTRMPPAGPAPATPPATDKPAQPPAPSRANPPPTIVFTPPDRPAMPGTPPPLTWSPPDSELPPAPVDLPVPGSLWLSAAAGAAMLWLRRKPAPAPAPAPAQR